MRRKFFKNLDWIILIIPIILSVIGIISIYSATFQIGLDEFYKQLKWIGIGIIFLLIFTIIDYEEISKYGIVGYIIINILLIAVLFMPARSGARSWFSFGSFLLQPAEIGKIFYIIFISNYISKIQVRSSDEINKFWKLISTLILAVIPIILIIIQPDYGTALVFVISLFLILFLAGIKKRYIFLGMIFSGIILFMLFSFILPKYAPHAIRRFNIFLNPEIDPRGDGYNTIQSKIAVGSGKIFGMGFKEGTQTQLGYLHPKTTDFIFSVISEEMGFAMSAFIVILYTILVSRIFIVAKTSKDKLGSYIAGGIGTIFLFHVFQNIGMTIGLMPITGIPLPFLSYGGSSTITNFALIGLALNISARRKRTILGE